MKSGLCSLSSRWTLVEQKMQRVVLCNTATLHDWKDWWIILYGLSTTVHILRAISHFLTISVVAKSTACERCSCSSRAFPSFKFLDPSQFDWATPKQQTWKFLKDRPCECLRLSNFWTLSFQIFKWSVKFLLEKTWSACSEHPSDQFSSWRWATSGRWTVRSFVPHIHHLGCPAFKTFLMKCMVFKWMKLINMLQRTFWQSFRFEMGNPKVMHTISINHESGADLLPDLHSKSHLAPYHSKFSNETWGLY